MSNHPDFIRTYSISFPAQPSDEIRERMKAAGMKYRRPEDPFEIGHAGVSGTWSGDLTSKELTTLDLPACAMIKQH